MTRRYELLPRRRRLTRDELLNAIDPGKCIALGKRWTGDLEAQVDDTISKIEPLVTGFTSGRVLHAEPAPEILDLGLRYVGALGTRMADAANEAQRQALEGGPADERIDVSEVADALNELEEEFASEPLYQERITDALQRLKRARDALSSRASRTTDSRQDWSARFLDQARDASRNGIARMNEANRANAASYADKQRQMAGARTTDSSVVPFSPQPRRPMTTIGEINEANRRNAARFRDEQRRLIEGDDDFPPRAA